MARNPEGWRLRKDGGQGPYLVRFRIGGRRVERSTGTGDQVEAAQVAERIYADAIQRIPQRKARVVRGEAPPLADLISTWLAGDSTLDADTAKVWETYGRHWLAHWPTLADVTDVTCDDYRNARLRKVQGTTVRKELGALRRFLKWCEARGYLPRTVVVPGVNSKTLGTNFGKRRRQKAADLSPEQIERLIAALPEWSTSKKVGRFAIRARFLVQYETGLRPSTISALSVPEHYHQGAKELNIAADIDKARWARAVPLSPAARKALEAVCPANGGLIFGGHDYRDHVANAAKATLPKAVADRFCGRTPAVRKDDSPARSQRQSCGRPVPRRAQEGRDDVPLHASLRACCACRSGVFRGGAAEYGGEASQATKDETLEESSNFEGFR